MTFILSRIPAHRKRQKLWPVMGPLGWIPPSAAGVHLPTQATTVTPCPIPRPLPRHAPVFLPATAAMAPVC
jgi:hypothetical protein